MEILDELFNPTRRVPSARAPPVGFRRPPRGRLQTGARDVPTGARRLLASTPWDPEVGLLPASSKCRLIWRGVRRSQSSASTNPGAAVRAAEILGIEGAPTGNWVVSATTRFVPKRGRAESGFRRPTTCALALHARSRTVLLLEDRREQLNANSLVVADPGSLRA